jgi:hypothetical protein
LRGLDLVDKFFSKYYSVEKHLELSNEADFALSEIWKDKLDLEAAKGFNLKNLVNKLS